MTRKLIFRLGYICILVLISSSAFSQSKTQSLDGEWQIIFDERNQGKESNWMQAEVFDQQTTKQNINVPIAWETIEQDYEGVAFYKKEFTVPKSWEGNTIRLQFGAVNYLAEVWLNDEVVGFHEGGFTPFEFRVDEMIKAGENNVLTLRVVGPLFFSTQEIDGIKAMETPQWRGGISGGIWQSVDLVATEEVYVKDVYLQPNIESGTVKFEVELNHTGTKGLYANIDLDILEQGRRLQTLSTIHENLYLNPGTNKSEWTLEIDDPILWSIDSPHLYVARVSVLVNDKTSDEWSTRFGMRELTIRNKDFYFNGEPIYLKASFFEGVYPNGIAYPDNEEIIREEIRLAKEAGFNMIRPWRRPPAPIWLDIADEMGILVVGSPALECMTLPVSTPYLPRRVEHEVRQAILRDRNRACVVQWELFNELHRPVLKQMMQPMAMMARELDPTRLILDESGGWAYGANMYLPYEYEPTKFNDIHNYPGPFINQDKYEGFLSIGMNEDQKKEVGYTARTPGRNVVPGLMSYVSELGYGSLPDLTANIEKFLSDGNPRTPAARYHSRIHANQQEVIRESGFRELYPDIKQFYLDQQKIHGTANRRMIEAVRANPEVDGYCIHALVAGDWILGAGLLDLWRQPKTYAYEGTKAANQPRILSIRTNPRNIYADEGTDLEIIGINELVDTLSELQVEIIDDRSRIVFRNSVDGPWNKGVSTLFKSGINTARWQGNYQINAKVVNAQGEILAENQAGIDVFTNRDIGRTKRHIAVYDEEGDLTRYLENEGYKVDLFDEEMTKAQPILVSGTKRGIDPVIGQLLIQFARNGGTVIYLEGLTQASSENNSLFPFDTKVHPVVGLWTCIPHLVKNHPIFEGLPSNQMMRDLYENVWARTSLRDISVDRKNLDVHVASIGFDWFSREHKLQYRGPGDSWWGTDLAEIDMGKGSLIISQLQIMPNLGKDPVADKLLMNLLRYANDK